MRAVSELGPVVDSNDYKKTEIAMVDLAVGLECWFVVSNLALASLCLSFSSSWAG